MLGIVKSLFLGASILVLIYPILHVVLQTQERKPCPIRVKRSIKR